MQILKIDESAITAALELYRQQLFTGSVKLAKTKAKDKININFTADAWAKQSRLIDDFTSEVAWHGLMRQLSPTEYEIYDILVYPQQVTGVTVETDQDKYNDWLLSQSDETFNNIRYQAHSHVNMSTSPSGVDDANESNIVNKLKGNDFYLFMIWNKRGEFTARLYDYAANKIYDKDDISVTYTDTLSDFAATAQSLVTKALPTYSKTNSSVKPTGNTVPHVIWDNAARCWTDDDGNYYDHYPTYYDYATNGGAL